MVVRGGYGLFFDKTHFELIAAMITAGVYSELVHGGLPGQRGGPGPVATASSRPTRSWSTGPP